jgi:AbiV family abortive infection protein
MRVRAIKDLTQLDDPAFFAAVADGLSLVMKNVRRLQAGAAALGEAKLMHPARVLTTVAEEEAAKVLILMDAVRCPRQPADRLARQLSRFNNHLPKGIYARVCGMRPVTLAQLQEYIDQHREEFYLDGPNDVDWIFRNEIIDGRESTLYVDYVARDDEHHWSDPSQFEDLYFSSREPLDIRMARYLYDAGLCGVESLAVVANIWRASPMESDTHWSLVRELNIRTLQSLDTRGLLQEQPQDVFGWIANEWHFPMYALDLAKIPVELEDLRERQRNWNPGWY